MTMDNNKPKPKPSLPKKPVVTKPVVEIEDVVTDTEIITEPVVTEVEPSVFNEVVIEFATTPSVDEVLLSAPSNAPVTVYSVVSGEVTDKVYLSKCVYKNLARKRSLTVHHLQRRLNEWGFTDAYLDKDGFYGELTFKSVANFQSSKGMQATGLMDAGTLEAIFEGDTNVTVVID